MLQQNYLKRMLTIVMFVALLGWLAGCKESATTETPAETETASDAQTTEGEAADTTETAATEGEAADAVFIDDFTVQCIDGSTFTLSEAQKDHERVLINLFATWCGPCRMEFPVMQEAWQANADRIAVIALSIEPNDTEDVLRDYETENGLSIPMGREEGTDLSRFVTEGIPTSILVDKTGRIVALEVGAMTSVEEFQSWFDGNSGDDYDPDTCTYTAVAYDTDYEDWNDATFVEGVVVNFCTDTTCTPVATDEEGRATFSAAPGSYHIQVASVPDGWQIEGDEDEWTSGPYAQTFYIPLTKTDA